MSLPLEVRVEIPPIDTNARRIVVGEVGDAPDRETDPVVQIELAAATDKTGVPGDAVEQVKGDDEDGSQDMGKKDHDADGDAAVLHPSASLCSNQSPTDACKEAGVLHEEDEEGEVERDKKNRSDGLTTELAP